MKSNPLDPRQARKNLARLKANPNSGCIVLVGTASVSSFSKNAYVTAVSIGAHSKGWNRKYEYDTRSKVVKTAFKIEPEKDTGTSLTIYPAMMVGNVGFDHIASNGDQTQDLCRGLEKGLSHAEIIESQFYKPDYTNRVSGSLELIKDSAPRIVMSTISKMPNGEFLGSDEHNDVLRTSWQLPSMCGIGYLLHTYEKDGNPIPPYLGAPKTIPLEGDPETMLATLWEAFNPQTHVAMALRVVDSVSGGCVTLIKNGDADIVTYQ